MARGEPKFVDTQWVEIRDSGIHGSGVFAAKPIPRGTAIIEYVGERITKAEVQRREDHRLAAVEQGADGCVYVFELNDRFDIDGNVPWNPARLINHSCEPNAEAMKDKGGIWISARRAISAGEEITYDYGFSFATWRDHPCRCGAASCVGYIVNRRQRWRVRKILAAEAM